MDIEKMLGETDFTSRSQVKDSLWERIADEWQHSRELSLEDLDMVAAAGNPLNRAKAKQETK